MAPTALISRFKALYNGEKGPTPPVLSTSYAIIILILYTLVYVLPFYASSSTRPSATLSRDAPSVIRARIRSVTISCILCSITTLLLLSVTGGNGGLTTTSVLSALHSMGYYPIGLLDTAKCTALTATLFLGPLFEAGIVKGGWRDWIRLRGMDEVIGSWMGWRNMVAGPITEEILFRSASVPPLLLANTRTTTIIFLTPLIFGLAHAHHFYEFRITHPYTPLIAAVLRTVLQLTYTTLFGGYATFLYMRTGSLLAVVVAHAFCNWMGFPRFWGRLSAGEMAMRVDVTEGKKSEDNNTQAQNRELGLGWTVAYYMLLVFGAAVWWKLLWSLTESSSALISF